MECSKFELFLFVFTQSQNVIYFLLTHDMCKIGDKQHLFLVNMLIVGKPNKLFVFSLVLKFYSFMLDEQL